MHSFSITSENVAISHILLEARFFGLHSCCRHCTSILNHFDTKVTEFGEITQHNGYCAVQGYSRSPILTQIESPYATSY